VPLLALPFRQAQPARPGLGSIVKKASVYLNRQHICPNPVLCGNLQIMVLKLSLARILAVAAVLAALSLASSPASAHAGHRHAAVAAPVSHEMPAAAAVTRAAEAVTAELRAPALPAPSSNTTCDGFGCCFSSCTGCHSFVAATVSVPMPLLAASSVVKAGAPPLSDPRDTRLRRPPKFFV
jgi:hypothetical protein